MRALPMPIERHRAPVVLSPRQVVAGWLAAALLVTGIGLWRVSVAHERDRAREAICAARLETWKATNVVLAKGVVRLATPCRTLAAVDPRRVP